MNPLVDTTEMYLRTIWELQEEGISPIRARLVERLGVSAPSVSETVARLADEGLVEQRGERTLALTDVGERMAVSVMRKHRLVERLLTDVVGLEFEHVHVEACRWEHVISDLVEQRIAALLGSPERCPHGNPIPGSGAADEDLVPLDEVADDGRTVELRRISEHLQGDVEAMARMRDAGMLPGARIEVVTDDRGLRARHDGHELELTDHQARLLYVAAPS